MSAAAKLSADWMYEIMQEATNELQKRPDWEIERLRSAPRMYPSIRSREESKTASAPEQAPTETRKMP